MRYNAANLEATRTLFEESFQFFALLIHKRTRSVVGFGVGDHQLKVVAKSFATRIMTVVEFVCHGFKVHGVSNLLEVSNNRKLESKIIENT